MKNCRQHKLPPCSEPSLYTFRVQVSQGGHPAEDMSAASCQRLAASASRDHVNPGHMHWSICRRILARMNSSLITATCERVKQQHCQATGARWDCHRSRCRSRPTSCAASGRTSSGRRRDAPTGPAKSRTVSTSAPSRCTVRATAQQDLHQASGCVRPNYLCPVRGREVGTLAMFAIAGEQATSCWPSRR